jgi:acetyl esterase
MAVLPACLSAAIPARAQVEKLPAYLQETLSQIRPVFQKDIGKTIPATVEAFQPLLRAAPKEGVTILRDQPYGEDPRQILDVYRPTARSGAPVVIFVHGGAYVRGDKDGNGEAYGNISIWFARQGMLGINATYPLAPAAKWPSGAKNVGGMVAWAKANAMRFGGDPNRIILIGHSAGATHVAGYVFDKSLQPPSGPGIAGAVLISGRYRVDYDPADPNGRNMLAYFGDDASQYASRSPITHIRDGLPVPVLLSSLNTTILVWMCAVPSCFPSCASATASVRALYGSIDITTYRKCLRSIRRTITSDAKSSILLTAAGRHPYLAKQVVGEVALVEVERRAGIKGDPPVRVGRYCRSPPIKLDDRHKLSTIG